MSNTTDSFPHVGDPVEDIQSTASYLDRAAEIIECATRGAHTTDGHPMKMSGRTARIIAEALADDGMLMPDDAWARVQERDAR